MKRSQSIATAGEYLGSSRQQRNRTKRHSDEIPNFSHFPAAGEDLSSERSFSRFTSSSRAGSPSGSSIASSSIPEEDQPQLPQEYNARHPPALPIVAQQAFTSMSDSLLPGNNPPNQSSTSHWNPSELGIVHLPSIPSSSLRSSRRGSERSSSSKLHQSNKGSQSSDSSGSSNLSKYHTPEEMSSGDDSKNHSVSRDSGQSSSSNSLASNDPEVPLVSVRFQHTQDEHGNHIVTGREGQLTRCEDEVCTPSEESILI